MYDKNDEPNEVTLPQLTARTLGSNVLEQESDTPKTPAELKAMKEAIALHTANAIAALKTTRQAIIDGAKEHAAKAKAAVKQADQDLRDLGAKREFKERKKRTPKVVTEPATTPAPAPKKKK